MNDDQGNGASGSIIAFSAGALLGAGIALILTPQSGAETRKLVRDYSAKAVDQLRARSQDAQTAVKTGREAVEAATEYGKHAYEAGKEAVKAVGKEVKPHV